MKNYFLVTFLYLIPSLAFSDEKTISLVSAEYPPFYGEYLQEQGPVSEIIIKAYEKSGYQVTIEFLPWARAMNEAKKGVQYDGMFAPWHTIEREKWFLYSKPFFPNEIGFYKLKEIEIDFQSYDDLMPYQIGDAIGYANPPDYQKANLNKSSVINDELNMVKLCKGRIDFALTDKVVGHIIVAEKYPNCLKRIEWMKPTLEVNPQHLVISKKTNHALKKLQAFNKGLMALKKDGTLGKILNRHGVHDF